MEWKVKQLFSDHDKTRLIGWNCEVLIPFSVLEETRKVPPGPGDLWRMNHYRIDRSGEKTDYSCWSPVMGERVSFHRPERFGWLNFQDFK